jgi:hypothetical protein
MWYNINWKKLVVLNQPTFLRKNVMVAFLRVLVEPINRLYYQWFIYRRDNLYKLAHNGQVCYLRKVLNDRFDPSQRRIYIGNGNKYDKNFIYTNPEQKPEFLGKIYLRQRSDYADTGVDFVVYAPTELLDTNNYEFKALINYYKEGAKRYKIEGI